MAACRQCPGGCRGLQAGKAQELGAVVHPRPVYLEVWYAKGFGEQGQTAAKGPEEEVKPSCQVVRGYGVEGRCFAESPQVPIQIYQIESSHQPVSSSVNLDTTAPRVQHDPCVPCSLDLNTRRYPMALDRCALWDNGSRAGGGPRKALRSWESHQHGRGGHVARTRAPLPGPPSITCHVRSLLCRGDPCALGAQQVLHQYLWINRKKIF